MKIYLVYLATGQVLVGRCSGGMEEVGPGKIPTTLHVDKPHEFAMGMNPQTRQQAPILIPYGSKGGLFPPLKQQSFQAVHVMHINECPKEIEDYYIEESSGIALA